MKNIRVSEEVWAAIAGRGRFGETEDDVLRRAFNVHTRSEKVLFIARRQRYATHRMSARVANGHMVVRFQDDVTTFAQRLPAQNDKQAIRELRDSAVAFAKAKGATIGQINAVRKTLTDNGYYVAK